MAVCGNKKQVPIMAIASAAIALTGCDVTEMATKMGLSGENVTLYLPPLIELQVDENQTAYVKGYDECPSGGVEHWFFTPSQRVFDSNCVKVAPNTKQVKVNLTFLDGRSWNESWAIKHDSDRIYMERPNGFIIRQTSK